MSSHLDLDMAQPSSEPSKNPDQPNQVEPDQTEVVWSDLRGTERQAALSQGSMLEALSLVERDLPAMLKYPEQWKTLDVTYHPPRVERVYADHGDLRVSLHCIHPCSRDDALFHPHPWPSAMRLLSGSYEMAVGYGDGNEPPPVASTIVLSEHSTYEMVDPDAWHYVRPIDEPVMTLMVTGKPWDRSTPRSSHPLVPLSDARRDEIISIFDRYYTGDGPVCP